MLLLLLLLQVPAPSCADAPDCRRLAVEAASRGEPEAFHDLAWRAVQKGKRNDPELMLLLARAQSLSGRPGDAIVMLARLVDLGVRPDVASDPDFAGVRALAGWPELEARLAGKPMSAAPATPPAAAPSAAAPAAPSTPAPKTTPPSAAPPASSAGLEFAASGIELFALAHDAVSRRFVLGDGLASRLLIVDEVSRNVVPYVAAASAGFLDQIAGFSIDARRGDLWVASTQGADGAAESALHKLQLVSGRPLLEARPAKDAAPVQFVAVTVAADGTVYLLDEQTPRVFRLRPGARTIEPVMKLDLPAKSRPPAAIAAADDGTLFVADATGLVRVDPAARTATRLKSAEDLGGFESLAWRDGALLGIERVAGSYLVVRVKLDASGTRAQPRQILAASPTAAVGTLAGDVFYYVAADHVIRRVTLK